MSGIDIDAKPSLKDARLRMFACVVVVMMSVDVLNPVKIIDATLGVGTLWAVVIALCILASTVIANFRELLYFAIVVFLKSILSIFYTSIEVLGKQNVPIHGPVIFTGNHMNQFVDGAMVFATNPHRVRFMVAAKSFNHKIVGFMARATGSIPVTRPQDSAKKGLGKVKLDGSKVYGDGTRFTDLQPGDKIRLNKSSSAFGVKHIVSDTEAELGSSDDGKSPSMEPQNTWMQFSVLYFVDQSEMFDAVHTALSRGQCLGIFPEGGSHDRTDLLPLKAGVAAIAFGALEKHGINVPIIPVGLTYWSGNKTGGDRFRGRAVVEFGQPIRISPEMATKYKESKRSAYTELLTEVSEGMRSVIVTADNYEDLQLIHTVRRLYKKPAQTVSIRERQDLSRRFALAVRILKNKHSGELPADLVSLRNKLGEYQKQLDYWGLKDYQINKLEVNVFRLLYTFLHGASIFLLASIPSILLNWPVGILAKIWAERGAKLDLAASVVKLKARDVVMSKKIVFSMAAVPMLWSFDALMLYLFLPLPPFAIMLLVLCMPLFSYLGVMAVEAGMVDLKDMRPVFMRLVSPSFKRKTREMVEMRAKLQKEVRALVRVYGPPLGALYYDKDLKIDAYKKEHERERNESKDLEDLEEVNGVGEGSGLSSLEPDGNGMRSVPSEFTFSTGAIDVPDERHSFGKTVSDAGLKKTE